jgi:hypothetical protein
MNGHVTELDCGVRVCALAGQQAQGQQGGRSGNTVTLGEMLGGARGHTANYNGKTVICKRKMSLKFKV